MKFCKNCEEWVVPKQEDHGYGVTEFWGNIQDHVIIVDVCPVCGLSDYLSDQTKCTSCDFSLQECSFYSIDGDFYCMECGPEYEKDFQEVGLNPEDFVHVYQQ